MICALGLLYVLGAGLFYSAQFCIGGNKHAGFLYLASLIWPIPAIYNIARVFKKETFS